MLFSVTMNLSKLYNLSCIFFKVQLLLVVKLKILVRQTLRYQVMLLSWAANEQMAFEPSLLVDWNKQAEGLGLVGVGGGGVYPNTEHLL